MKQIAFLIKAPSADMQDKIVAAFFDEETRDKVYESLPHKAYCHTTEVIVESESARRIALNKLDGMDMLILGIENPRYKLPQSKTSL